MNETHNKKLTAVSKALRKNMTKEERHLWYDFLKNLPCTVHRQKVVGPFVVDFYCACAHLAIELDGSQHFEQAGLKKDSERDAFLRGLGLTVLRYSNLDVNKNFEGVCLDILKHINNNTSSVTAPPCHLLLEEKAE